MLCFHLICGLFVVVFLQIAVVLIDGILEKPMQALKEARRANIKGIEVRDQPSNCTKGTREKRVDIYIYRERRDIYIYIYIYIYI